MKIHKNQFKNVRFFNEILSERIAPSDFSLHYLIHEKDVKLSCYISVETFGLNLTTLTNKNYKTSTTFGQ